MSISVLTIKDPDGNLLSVEVGDSDTLYDRCMAQLGCSPMGTRLSMHRLAGDSNPVERIGCQHRTKVRLLGADPRLWRCAGARILRQERCPALFVEGRSWRGEPRWIPTGRNCLDAFTCAWCLDGFCTSVDNSPCSKCGAATARLVGGTR